MILCSWGLMASTLCSKVTELQSKLSGWRLMHTCLSQRREDRQPCFLNLPCRVLQVNQTLGDKPVSPGTLPSSISYDEPISTFPIHTKEGREDIQEDQARPNLLRLVLSKLRAQNIGNLVFHNFPRRSANLDESVMWSQDR